MPEHTTKSIHRIAYMITDSSHCNTKHQCNLLVWHAIYLGQIKHMSAFFQEAIVWLD